MNRLILLLAIVLAAVGQPAVGQTCLAVPSGAAALGYTVQMFSIVPTVAMVSTTDTNSNSALYPGLTFSTVATNLQERKSLSTTNGVFTINYTGAGNIWVNSETHQATQGTLPLLLGSNGFYIEAGIRLSSNDPDNYPAFFLMPAEHNAYKADHIATSPPGYENWLEIDVLEDEDGGLAQHNLINYQGIYPNYTRTTNYWRHPAPFDWTVEHIFGASFDPIARVVQFYIDGIPTFKASMVTAPTIVDTYHYYFILGTRNHGLLKPYQMYVSYVAAYSK